MITTALRVLGTILSGPMLLLGVIWALQGVGVLPGSFMSGDIKWTLIGIPTAIAGGLLVWWLNRRPRA
jgi:hypothetical protein